MLESDALPDDIKKSLNEAFKQMSCLFGSIIEVIYDQERIRENSKVFDFQLEQEDMKLLDSLNENLQTVFLG